METTEKSMKETIQHGVYTIHKDFERLTVLITRPSPRARMGIKIVYNYSFKSTDISKSVMRMNLFVDKFIQDENAKAQGKADDKAKLAEARKNFVNPFKVGDIFYRSWGYDQTNVNFYQCIEIKGKTLTLREVAQTITEYHSSMSGKTTPVIDSFLDREELKRIIQVKLYDGKPRYEIEFQQWDGNPKYWSNYA